MYMCRTKFYVKTAVFLFWTAKFYFFAYYLGLILFFRSFSCLFTLSLYLNSRVCGIYAIHPLLLLKYVT